MRHIINHMFVEVMCGLEGTVHCVDPDPVRHILNHMCVEVMCGLEGTVYCVNPDLERGYEVFFYMCGHEWK